MAGNVDAEISQGNKPSWDLVLFPRAEYLRSMDKRLVRGEKIKIKKEINVPGEPASFPVRGKFLFSESVHLKYRRRRC